MYGLQDVGALTSDSTSPAPWSFGHGEDADGGSTLRPSAGSSHENIGRHLYGETRDNWRALIHQKMLEVCHRWGAVLLIDDLPFLWSRMSLLAQQKQWPSVVLQHLTSPRGQGVIFFTCKGNHVNWGEGALSQSKVTAFPLAIIGCMRLTFGSFKTQEGMPKFRFNLSFRYTFPTRHGRMHLIRKCLARALERGQVHIAPLNDVGMRRLGDSGLNYRETRNVVQLALDWACEKGELMPLAVLQRLLDMPREHRSGPASVDGVQPSTPSPSLGTRPDLG